MNFIKFFIIILMFFIALPQSIATKNTIKPVIQIFKDDQKLFFIGFEEKNNQFKTAQLYSIENSELKKLDWHHPLNEKESNYFVSGHKGDITGDGIDEFILIVTDPNIGTRIHAYTIENVNQFKRTFYPPYKIKTKQTEAYPTKSFLAMIYPDKDQEIVISLSSPDRKAIILDYAGKLQQTDEIGKKFLSNTAGVVVMEKTDIDEDGLDDIYLLNNGPQTIEATQLSSERKKLQQQQIKFKQPIQDVFFGNNEDIKLGKVILFKNGELFLEKWDKTINTKIQNPKETILLNKNLLSIIDQEGTIYHFEIKEPNQEMLFTKKIKTKFLKKHNTNLHYLITEDKENIIISHNEFSEIIYQPLYKNIKLANKEEERKTNTAKKQQENKQKETLTTQIKEKEEETKKDKKNNQKEEKQNTTKKTKTTKNKEQPKTKINKPTNQQTIFLNADTVVVNVGEKTQITIDFNTQYEPKDIVNILKPSKTTFDLYQNFTWEPAEEDIGYHNLQYTINYEKYLGFKEKDGKQSTFERDTEQIEEIKKHIIYVNDKPTINIDSTTYNIQANHQLVIPLTIKDKNKDQKPTINFNLPNSTNTKIVKETFFWTPNNQNHGENKITFSVSDGFSTNYTTAFIYVDTLKKIIMNEEKFITTVNKEFVHKIEHTKKATYKKEKGPHNLRISKQGIVHWIPISTQLGYNDIIIEATDKQQTISYALKIFVNSPPVISYRPDDIEYINHKDVFSFQLESFDENVNQKNYFKLIETPENMVLNNATLVFQGLNIDYNNYSIELSDTIDVDIFKGSIYVNGAPQLDSIPNQHITLGDTLLYKLKIQDPN